MQVDAARRCGRPSLRRRSRRRERLERRGRRLAPQRAERGAPAWHVHHRTTYLYSEAVEFGRHRSSLRPREGHDLRIVEMALRIDAAARNHLGARRLRQLARARRLHRARRSARGSERRHRRAVRPVSRATMFARAVGSCSVARAIRSGGANRDRRVPPLVIPRRCGGAPAVARPASVGRAEDTEGTLLDLCGRVHEAIAYRRRCRARRADAAARRYARLAARAATWPRC